MTEVPSIAFEDERILTLGLFLEAHAELVAVLDQELRDGCGLPLRWFEVLIRLARSSGRGLTASELARAIALSSGGATRLVDRLCEEALVERRPDAVDRRMVRVVLTSNGLDVLSTAVPVHLDGIDRHLVQPLGASRMRSLARASRVLRDALADQY